MTSCTFEARPLVVLALGGNALSPPGMTSDARESDDYRIEREIVSRTAAILSELIRSGYRLLIVHGNGPQVGRLLRHDPQRGNLDIHVAQTQGELGYLLVSAIGESPGVCVVTRAVVTEPPGLPVKPIGPFLDEAPVAEPCIGSEKGWRVTVPSPRPARIVEAGAIGLLLQSHHVVAGGGGGVPIDGRGQPLNCVVDKDWVACLLAIDLEAEHLVFATDVDAVYRQYGQRGAQAVSRLSVGEAQAMIQDGAVGAGSMAPKLASASDYVLATSRPAHICGLADVAAAVSGRSGSGTVIAP